MNAEDESALPNLMFWCIIIVTFTIAFFFYTTIEGNRNGAVPKCFYLTRDDVVYSEGISGDLLASAECLNGDVKTSEFVCTEKSKLGNCIKREWT